MTIHEHEPHPMSAPIHVPGCAGPCSAATIPGEPCDELAPLAELLNDALVRHAHVTGRWDVEETGGGCTALVGELPDGVQVGVTDAHDPNRVAATAGLLLVCVTHDDRTVDITSPLPELPMTVALAVAALTPETD